MILVIAAIAVLPLASANPIYVPSDTEVVLLGFPLILLIPLLFDAVALKVGLYITKTKPKSFLKLLATLWAVGYLADICTIILFQIFSPSLPRSHDSLFWITLAFLAALSFLVIFLLDNYTLSNLLKFEKATSKKISAVMGILTNLFLLYFAILLLFYFVWWPVIGHPSSYPTCVSNPINELVTAIQKAESGITTSTDAICMNNGYGLSDTALTNKVTNVESITFKCSGAAVCKNNNPLDVSDGTTIKAIGNLKFKGLVTCTKSGDKYDCEIEIQSA